MASKQDPKPTQAELDKQPKAGQKSNEAADHKQSASSKAIATDKGATDDPQGLDSLLETLSGDLSAIDPDAAMNLLDEWYASLHKAKEPEVKELANGLKQLKQALKGGKASGHEIGELLEHLGEETSTLAAEAEKGLKTPLRKLGKQLAKDGRSLSKAEDQGQVEQVESLVDVLEGDLSEVDTDQAIAAIDEWYALLHKSDDEGQQAIANQLKQLKQALSKGKGNIGELLTQLGEQTTEAASEAGRGLKGPIQRLGKLLSKTGKSLS